MTPICENCIYWTNNTGTLIYGLCHLNPKTVEKMSNDFCGQCKTKDNKKD